MLRNTSVAVIGLGYVGLPLALLADRNGYYVIGIDLDASKIAKLATKQTPVEDPGLSESPRASNLTVSTAFDALGEIETVIICVGTPVNGNFQPDLTPLKRAVEQVGRVLQPGQLVILESTVNPGVCETVVRPILERESGLVAGRDFELAHCPERINPGDSQWNVANIPRVVGSLTPAGLERATAFYRSIIEADIKPMATIQEAEAVKIVENSFRDVNIAFVNELAMSFSRLGINVMNVLDGAATKPFAFMRHNPACGVGGHCIPVDPYYLIEHAKTKGFNHDFLSLARRINNHMPIFTAERTIDGLNKREIAAKGTKVAVLGVAYKAGIEDFRESPSLKIINHLSEKGADVAVFDPYVPDKSTTDTLDEALAGAKAVVLATDHAQFRDLSARNLAAAGVEVFVDGRNCRNRTEFEAAGLVYEGIGV